MKKRPVYIAACCLLAILTAGPAWAETKEPATDATGQAVSEKLDKIMAGVESRYEGPGFAARFHQTSTIASMDITDAAEGNLLIKRPDMMRWEYETPEKQLIVTDGESLWMYRPEDNQVMTGKAPSLFGNGKGAGFLTDIATVTEDFDVTVLKQEDPAVHRLRLIPKTQTLEVSDILLRITATDYVITQIATSNAYGDETVITLSDYAFGLDPRDDLFVFVPPEGAEVLLFDE